MIDGLRFALHKGFRRGGASPLYLTYKDRGDDRVVAWQCWSDLTGLSSVVAMVEGQEKQEVQEVQDQQSW
jgi:hypothetical protein